VQMADVPLTSRLLFLNDDDIGDVLDKVNTLERISLGNTSVWTEESLVFLTAQAGGILVLERTPGVIVGSVVFNKEFTQPKGTPPIFVLKGFAILPTENIQEVASKLREVLIPHAIQSGAHVARVMVKIRNTNGQMLYQKYGFQCVSTKGDYQVLELDLNKLRDSEKTVL